MLPNLSLVLGGAASGKSLWAENHTLNSGLEPVYLATSRIFDDEIKIKINFHKKRRDHRWLNIEADAELQSALSQLQPTQAVLIDCATMWLTNQMMDEKDLQAAQADFLNAIRTCRAPVVVVSNEVGQGIVPDNAMARTFREAQGRLNIALADQADTVVLVTAGLPLVLKGTLA
ncbi:bifunctional adenosylcobinamide kinase/adenosylcobinamide-phosphate guanylyltransferase [Roseobacter denitrificans]|uniref:Bifunctional adenosylcobalamin biosynthesis protein n=1 Tax=Roseobacter denitrificans (strain ATCC 33942 / OCh 114) TaxID=375451 RepID=Q16AZ7_ROSDO|nr:bifunctional adenosylcobinamide kinase/adenosylcobinamide-phosphate guanylyltransferase [Roseobacter denitrificans]ABG30846.1 bifunctional adenosylcobalamin biosynthesis protein cobP [Roseobacter denitrificans OCh 114]AVL53950.1 bifunctional adenosylcobinamide kinase/adenosylcobinamide-phosphate guanylyltransferase [Roseobacter denitrificans]SFG15326.1 adenosylcobinamide kinase /adenosylcobinamide-phosphate guanylyltransferase [Roseobacter denitrificans OCh 114]